LNQNCLADVTAYVRESIRETMTVSVGKDSFGNVWLNPPSSKIADKYSHSELIAAFAHVAKVEKLSGIKTNDGFSISII